MHYYQEFRFEIKAPSALCFEYHVELVLEEHNKNYSCPLLLPLKDPSDHNVHYLLCIQNKYHWNALKWSIETYLMGSHFEKVSIVLSILLDYFLA